MRSFELIGADGKRIKGDRIDGTGRQILFITGFLSKRWGNKSKAMTQWCQERGWRFCCYDVRGYGDSEGEFTDYTLSDWIIDARTVLDSIKTGPPVTIVGNSLGSWIAWLVAQEFLIVEELILIAPAFNMMGERAKTISPERLHDWHTAGWMPWDDDPLHREWPLSWKWVEESEQYWTKTFDVVRHVKTTILHGQDDRVISPEGSRRFANELTHRHPGFPLDLRLLSGDHRLSGPEHLDLFRRLIMKQA
ncbi:MAG TPA: alpha/beta fold hydrolase [Nitrospira sp.]|nr:alpha/beta fold hydrolase [Nitrospira sp.]